MKALASVITPVGTAAISSVQVYGADAVKILRRIFVPDNENAFFKQGRMILGRVVEGQTTVDQVLAAVETDRTVTINCHGNPIIVEKIVKLLEQSGAEYVEYADMLRRIYSFMPSTIQSEAMIEKLRAASLTGVKLIRAQVTHGLLPLLNGWYESRARLSMDEIRQGCQNILTTTKAASVFIKGARVVLTGPPNSGKSTLFNMLCARPDAVVTETPGTTRDWLSARLETSLVSLEMVDTAGLDPTLTGRIDAAAQESSHHMLESAQLILLVLDKGCPRISLPPNVPVIAILNKADLPIRMTESDISVPHRAVVRMSAKTGKGAGRLIEAIHKTLNITDFDHRRPACFTQRQVELVERLAQAKSVRKASGIISKLLNDE